jgi:aconitate hydratase
VLLGVRAVIAETFERIHRSNLVNMGVLPLQFLGGQHAAALELTGREEYDIVGVTTMTPRGRLAVRVKPPTGGPREFQVIVRIDTPEELESFRHGGILPYTLRQLAVKG